MEQEISLPCSQELILEGKMFHVSEQALPKLQGF